MNNEELKNIIKGQLLVKIINTRPEEDILRKKAIELLNTNQLSGDGELLLIEAQPGAGRTTTQILAIQELAQDLGVELVKNPKKDQVIPSDALILQHIVPMNFKQIKLPDMSQASGVFVLLDDVDCNSYMQDQLRYAKDVGKMDGQKLDKVQININPLYESKVHPTFYTRCKVIRLEPNLDIKAKLEGFRSKPRENNFNI